MNCEEKVLYPSTAKIPGANSGVAAAMSRVSSCKLMRSNMINPGVIHPMDSDNP